MPKATTCILESEVISINAALFMRDQAKNKHMPKPNFLCIECNNNVRPHRKSPFGSAHFEHKHKNAKCSLSNL
jgi:uncharacterized protein YlaI